MLMRRSGMPVVIAIVALTVAGCVARQQAGERHYVQIAEGLSSPSIAEAIRVAPRMFSASQLVEACRTAQAVARLKVEPKDLRIATGHLYQLSSLTVVAVNAADIAVPGTPVVLEAEDTNPPVLQLRSDDPDLNEGRVRVIGSGEFRLRVRTICGAQQAETIITGRAGS